MTSAHQQVPQTEVGTPLRTWSRLYTAYMWKWSTCAVFTDFCCSALANGFCLILPAFDIFCNNRATPKQKSRDFCCFKRLRGVTLVEYVRGSSMHQVVNNVKVIFYPLQSVVLAPLCRYSLHCPKLKEPGDRWLTKENPHPSVLQGCSGDSNSMTFKWRRSSSLIRRTFPF